jgi:hypothetical protein
MSDEAKFTQADLDAAIEKAVGPLKAKVEEVMTEAKDAKRKLREASEIKPEDLTAAEDRADKAEAKAKELEKQVGTLTKERDTATKALEAENGFTSKLLIQDGIKSALIASGVKDEDFLDALTTKFAGGATIVADGELRKAMIGDKVVGDAIKEWAVSDAGKKFVAAPNNSGGGATGGAGAGGAGNNPFAKDTFNMTEQARIINSDPEKARSLAKSAGVELAI